MTHIFFRIAYKLFHILPILLVHKGHQYADRLLRAYCAAAVECSTEIGDQYIQELC